VSNNALFKVYFAQEGAKTFPWDSPILRMDTAHRPDGVRTNLIYKDLRSIRNEASGNKERWTWMEIELVPPFPAAACPSIAQRLRHTIEVCFQLWAWLFMRSYKPTFSTTIYKSISEYFGG
jgi:hypothetical protein